MIPFKLELPAERYWWGERNERGELCATAVDAKDLPGHRRGERVIVTIKTIQETAEVPS